MTILANAAYTGVTNVHRHIANRQGGSSAVDTNNVDNTASETHLSGKQVGGSARNVVQAEHIQPHPTRMGRMRIEP